MLTLDQVQDKSEARLKGLNPALMAYTKELIQQCYFKDVPIIITQGLRTIAEQNALYAQGRSKPGPIVTYARGGTSYHNYGLAVDFALLLPDGNTVSWNMSRDLDQDRKADWQEVVTVAKQLGFEWGGDWTSFKDNSHLQITFGLTINLLRTGKRPTAQQVQDLLTRISGGDNGLNKDAKVTITINGQKLTEGFIDSGTTYAPIRAIAQALGATVTFDPGSKTVDIIFLNK
ncbi:M15 family metallopeptidase [Paenibacillus wynnii]|uniref:M15 family metallopeptidase n=1 Tax=Paenibacillus wynnii TaxID=268407 RepID=UPI00278F4D6B|nr:M15 family metallopeptidase [Paenibacillus wynnii]MDQ0192531.1 peptidoglycan L-alanyl-D-glutamate endopeptidase CwlK [Paenibacillus wynnii]